MRYFCQGFFTKTFEMGAVRRRDAPPPACAPDNKNLIVHAGRTHLQSAPPRKGRENTLPSSKEREDVVSPLHSQGCYVLPKTPPLHEGAGLLRSTFQKSH